MTAGPYKCNQAAVCHNAEYCSHAKRHARSVKCNHGNFCYGDLSREKSQLRAVGFNGRSSESGTEPCGGPTWSARGCMS